MASLNHCMFIGNLGGDPETRYLPSGEALCNFSIGCNWKSKENEGVEWIRISAFGKLAEICGEYLKKGAPVFISGRMQTRKWEDKESGQERYSTEIVAEKMQMLGKKDGTETQRREPAAAATGKPQGKKGGGAFDQMDDDIPF